MRHWILLALVVASCSHATRTSGFTGGRDAKVITLAGAKVRLSSLARPVTVLSFWESSCAPCMMELPELDRVAAEYAEDPDVAFVAVNVGDPPERAKETAEKLGLKLPVVLDAGQKLSKRFSPDGMSFPMLITVGPKGLFYQEAGFQVEDERLFAARRRLVVAGGFLGVFPPVRRLDPADEPLEMTWNHMTRRSYDTMKPRIHEMVKKIRPDLEDAAIDGYLEAAAVDLNDEPRDMTIKAPARAK